MTAVDDSALRSSVDDELLVAQTTLSAFILQAAEQTANEVGFGYILTPDAPSAYHDLCTAFERSVSTGCPLPISSENCDDIIYDSPRTNGALRFWHDVNHVRRRLNFGVVDELELSLWHLDEVEKAGHPPGSLVYKMLHADLTGQVYVQAFAQRFPADQRRFVAGCVAAGFDHGLLKELRHREQQL